MEHRYPLIYIYIVNNSPDNSVPIIYSNKLYPNDIYVGKYFVTVTPIGFGPFVNFDLNGAIQSGSSAFFNNITITATNNISITLDSL